jgi:hypothetical protein
MDKYLYLPALKCEMCNKRVVKWEEVLEEKEEKQNINSIDFTTIPTHVLCVLFEALEKYLYLNMS